MFPTAALVDCDTGLLDVVEEVLLALVLAGVRVVERVPFELGATVVVAVALELAVVDTRVTVLEGV